jgi:hypothetical protein
MKKIILIISVAFCLNGFALEVSQNKNDLEVAFGVTDKYIEIQMEAPMELLIGFSHKPSTDLEVKKWEQLQDKWFNNLNTLIEIQGLGCTEEESSIEYEVDEEFSNTQVLAQTILKCNKTLSNEIINIKFKEHFPHVKNVNLSTFPNKGPLKDFVLTKKVEKISL